MGRYLLIEALSGEAHYMWEHVLIPVVLAPDTDVSIHFCSACYCPSSSPLSRWFETILAYIMSGDLGPSGVRQA